MVSLLDRLPKVRGSYRENHEIAPLTWFRVGGPAAVLFRPADAGDLAEFIANKPSDIPASVRELVVNAAKAATSPVKLALVDVCAGSASTLPDLAVLTKEVEAGLAAALASPPQFLCFFTFGEQGMVDGQPTHCNLMVNVALVG